MTSLPKAKLMLELKYTISKGILDVRGTRHFWIQASSGKGTCMNRAECMDHPFEGPLPDGDYAIDSRQLSDPWILNDIARNLRGDWGDWRVPLIPSATTNTYGRRGFFLHGGSFLGSAGCIDIGGGLFGTPTTDLLLRMITSETGTISVRVVE
jgi:Protein of unknown function (DUF2778)